MSDRLLSELFPRFVKKSQIERLAKGPFGEGLDAAGLDKARVYLKPGEQAPEGAQVQTGARGGQYYDEAGGGSTAAPEDQAPQRTYESVPEDMADRQQTAIDQMQQINQQRMAEYQDAKEAGPEALAEWEASDAQRKEGEAAARADIEGLREARAQGPEAEAAYKDKRKQEESARYQALVAKVEAELPNTVIEDGPLKGKTFGEVDQELQEFAAKVDMEVGANREKVAKVHELLSGQSQEQRQEGIDAAMADIEARRAQNEAEAAGQQQPAANTGDAEYDELASKFEGVVGRDERGYLEQPSEPVFSDGAVLVPGSDPYSIDEIVRDGFGGIDPAPLIRQYEAETGNSISDDNFVTDEYYGPLNHESVIDHMWDQGYGGQTYAQTLETPAEYELSSYHENLAEETASFFDWFASKNTPETQKMMKMMQKYNVDNKRRDPIVLSNKGGRQR